MTNMTIFKSPEYSCLQICNVDDAKVIVIDRICTCSKLIFQPESNKHRTTTGNQKTHRTKTGNQNKQSRAETTKSQKQTKENRKYVKSLIQLGYKEKQLRGVTFESKLTLNHPSGKKKKKKGVTARV